MAKRRTRAPGPKHTFDARPDTTDFRDRMYEPTLVEVPTTITLESYHKVGVPILDQGQQGACTGFGLATVANFLLRRRHIIPDDTPVSARMFYDMARRYDEFPGTNNEGSSARGAMKGWQKHGVCSEELWRSTGRGTGTFSHTKAIDAARRPLGAYLRVNHHDLVAMHAAIAEVGTLYATSDTHAGWDKVPRNGHVPYLPGSEGVHAVAIVAYDDVGFWIQNSWGKSWGFGGFGRIEYSDWLSNATDVWVARLAAPVRLGATPNAPGPSRSGLAGAGETPSKADLRPHIISLGDNGELRNTGPFGTTSADVDEILTTDFARITKGWSKPRILLYAHGGLVDEDSAIQHVAAYRPALLENEVYPLAFIWKTDLWTTITNIVKDALSRRRAEGIFEGAKDFLLDRADDFIEPLARTLGGKTLWDEMKKNALAASNVGMGGTQVLNHVNRLAATGVEVHLAAHSAGSILLAPMFELLAAGVKVKTCTLWAPAVTMALYETTYHPALLSGKLSKMALFTLKDDIERDDNCAMIYNKSLLYLVSDAFEATQRIPLLHPDGEPLLGLAKSIKDSSKLKSMISRGQVEWVLAPNDDAVGTATASRARHHGDFDDDPATVKAALRRIIGTNTANATFDYQHSASSRRDLRKRMLVDSQ